MSIKSTEVPLVITAWQILSGFLANTSSVAASAVSSAVSAVASAASKVPFSIGGMSVWQFTGGILLLISSIVLIVIVLSQHGRNAGLSGTIAGGAETFLGKNKGRSVDAMLTRMTKWIAIFFALMTVILNLFVIVFKL
jgi:preprotein translocase subunit SecG